MTKIVKEKNYRFEIPDGKKKERIDIFLAKSIENATRSRIKNLIDANLVLVNGKPVKASYKVTPDNSKA